MLIRTIALHSPSTSLGYTNNTLEGEISQMILFGSAVTCTGARIEVKKKSLRAAQMSSYLALDVTKTPGT
jgi:hypothetical protein